MPRSTNETLLEELLSVKSWPILLYDIQIKDEGIGIAGANQLTCTDKAYDGNEWQTSAGINDAELTDANGDTFTIGVHAEGNVLTNLSGTPVDGEFTLEKWLYLADMPEEYTGSYTRITYNSKQYLPYPIQHGAIEDHELGQFPQIVLSLHNPGTSIIDLYKVFERYNGMRGCVVYITLAFIDTDGNIHADVDATIVDKFIINSSTITHSTVSFEMQSTGNLGDKTIPSSAYSRFTCDYVYKGSKCKYSGDLTSCNKLYSSAIMVSRKCTNTVGQTFQVPADVTLPDSNALAGCKVIAVNPESAQNENAVNAEGYIWEIVSNNTTTFTTTSDSGLKDLSDYTTSNEIILSIIDKDSCLGHSDTGGTKAPQWIRHSTWADDSSMVLEKGNLLADSDFTYGFTIAWNEETYSSGLTIEDTSGFVYIKKDAVGEYGNISQTCPYLKEEDSPELNHHYQFYMQYYGFTRSGSTAYININLNFTFHTVQYYNFETKTWESTKQNYQLPLRGTDFKTDFSKVFDENIKPDEFSHMVKLDWATLAYAEPHIATNMNLVIGVESTDTVLFELKIYRVGLFRYLPHEHARRFPGIPLTRLWYV